VSHPPRRIGANGGGNAGIPEVRQRRGTLAATGAGILLLLGALAACDSAPPEDRPDRRAAERAAFVHGPREVLVFFARKDTCEIRGFPREVTGDTPLAVTRAALDSMVAGPRPDEAAEGWITAIPDSAEASRHLRSHRAFGLDPRHEGGRPALRDLRELEGGLLLCDFNAAVRAYDHGRRDAMPARLCSITRQVQETVGQFPWWNGVMLAIEGETKGEFQP
jgi:hypothetical protein